MVRLLYRERVDDLFIEFYDRPPYVVFRDVITGRFVPRPSEIWAVKVCGGETGGGKQPIRIEAINHKRITLEELVTLGHQLLEDLQDIMEEEIWDALYSAGFGHLTALLECKMRELTLERPEREGVLIRWRHYKKYLGRWEEWREMWF